MQKVDIYALGIIFFEMVHPPLPTIMERVKVLTDLRKKEIIFPASFDLENWAKEVGEGFPPKQTFLHVSSRHCFLLPSCHVVCLISQTCNSVILVVWELFQAQVIRWLLGHSPQSRPTSVELLQSPLIPLKIVDRQLQEACSGLCSLCLCFLLFMSVCVCWYRSSQGHCQIPAPLSTNN